MTTISPGEVRAIAWISYNHPDSELNLEDWRDESDTGWLSIFLTDPELIYVASPTGRVWLSTNGKDRVNVVRESDYESPIYT